jgi:hypothetical protein
LNFWITGRKFNISGTPSNIASINCNKTPKSEFKVDGKCHNNHSQYNIGFQLMDEDFIGLIEVCFDSILYTTLYTKFTIVSGVDEECQTAERPNYFKQDYFNGIRSSIEDAYKTKFQSDIGKREALDRGHLAACADFSDWQRFIILMPCLSGVHSIEATGKRWKEEYELMPEKPTLVSLCTLDHAMWQERLIPVNICTSHKVRAAGKQYLYQNTFSGLCTTKIRKETSCPLG